MANRITYKPSGILLSSAIGDVGLAVDGSYIDVRLTAATGGKVLLAERYYALQGNITLYDLGSLIEFDMRTSGVSFAKFTLSIFTDTPGNNADSWTMTVLFCDRYTVCTDVPFFLQENFLTTLSTRRLPLGASLDFSYYAEKGESTAVSVACRYRLADSDEIRKFSFVISSGATASASGVYALSLSVATVIDKIAKQHSVKTYSVDLLMFTVLIGQRCLTAYIDRSLNFDDVFLFRNCFNAFDCAYLHKVTTAKTDVDRSTAIINGVSRFYNQSTTKKYEVQAGPLTSDEADWLDQLLTAHDVFRFEPNKGDEYDPYIVTPILITDSTCEMQDGDEKLNSVKFTWRFADNRPLVRLSASQRIFTDPYNPVYS